MTGIPGFETPELVTALAKFIAASGFFLASLIHGYKLVNITINKTYNHKGEKQ